MQRGGGYKAQETPGKTAYLKALEECVAKLAALSEDEGMPTCCWSKFPRSNIFHSRRKAGRKSLHLFILKTLSLSRAFLTFPALCLFPASLPWARVCSRLCIRTIVCRAALVTGTFDSGAAGGAASAAAVSPTASMTAAEAEAYAAAHEYDDPNAVAHAHQVVAEVAKSVSLSTPTMVIDKFPKGLTQKHLGMVGCPLFASFFVQLTCRQYFWFSASISFVDM